MEDFQFSAMRQPQERVQSIHGSFFFVDVVGLSDPGMSAAMQVRKIEFLNGSIATCKAFKTQPKNQTLVLPTGDGMAIGFLQGPELPLKLAIELHKIIREHNKGKLPTEVVEVRIGIHSGPVFTVRDIRGNSNIWGPGIIMARRVMDVGDHGHILLSSRVADDLIQLSHEYAKILHPLERYLVKHNLQIMIYSAYGSNFGNPKLPAKIKSRSSEFLYSHVKVQCTLVDPQKMLVHYKRTYTIENKGEHPTSTVTHQIATDVEKNFDDLHIRVYDENDNQLKISSIELDTFHQKEFATTFSKPISQGQKTTYHLEYDVEEPDRYFENMFLTNCKEFVLSFEHKGRNSVSSQIRGKTPILPKVFEVNPENDHKERSSVKPTMIRKSDGTVIASWVFHEITKGRCLRIEW